MHPLARLKAAVIKFGGIVAADQPVNDLDFERFKRNGFVVAGTGAQRADIIGYPSKVQRIAAGQKLGNGEAAAADCWWLEFIAIRSPKAEDVTQAPKQFTIVLGETRRNFANDVCHVEHVRVVPLAQLERFGKDGHGRDHGSP